MLLDLIVAYKAQKHETEKAYLTNLIIRSSAFLKSQLDAEFWGCLDLYLNLERSDQK